MSFLKMWEVFESEKLSRCHIQQMSQMGRIEQILEMKLIRKGRENSCGVLQ